MASVDLDSVIKKIDQKIRALEQAKRVLLEEFGGGGRVETPHEHPLSGFGDFVPPESKITSKEAIAKLLEKEGPLSRNDIIQRTGLKPGTVSFALNEKKLFEHKKRIWYLKGGGQGEKE